MSRQFVTIRQIGNIESIPNAERVELACIDGWQCVVPKNEFTPGEEIIFFEADAALKNVNDERYNFLHKSSYKCWHKSGELLEECFRIKTIKLAGQISQGLVLKKKLFDREIKESLETGKSLDEVCRVVHYDELYDDMHAILDPKNQAERKGSFPSFIHKTDEERLQNLPKYFSKYKNECFEVTEKYDGNSMTVGYSPTYLPEEPFFVCSRKNSLKLDGDNNFVKMAVKYDLQNKLKHIYDDCGAELCIQGELVGPGIHGNHDGHKEIDFYVFRIYDIKEQAWLSSKNRISICNNLELKHVPVVNDFLHVFEECKNINDVIALTKRNSLNGNQIEGLVFKSIDRNVSFKVINPDYLLKIEKE